jgi:2-hydroxy-6-oxonona-2,4-dienedioate hydrolase
VSGAILQYPRELGGLISRVLECGDGSRSLVCLHGAGSRADRWRPALPLLAAAGYRVYALDFPGHGLAAKPSGFPFGSPAFSAVVEDFIDGLDEPTVSILGTSIGGHVAAMVACARPDQVRSVVLIGAVGLTPRSRGAEPPRSPIIDASVAGIRAKLELLVENQELVTDDWVREEAHVNSSPGASDALAELGRYSVEELEGDVIGERFAALGIPAMLCWGEQDRWIPPSVGHDAARLLPKAPFALLRGAGHAPYFERPEAFVATVVPFLDDPAGLPSGTFTV